MHPRIDQSGHRGEGSALGNWGTKVGKRESCELIKLAQDEFLLKVQIYQLYLHTIYHIYLKLTLRIRNGMSFQISLEKNKFPIRYVLLGWDFSTRTNFREGLGRGFLHLQKNYQFALVALSWDQWEQSHCFRKNHGNFGEKQDLLPENLFKVNQRLQPSCGWACLLPLFGRFV